MKSVFLVAALLLSASVAFAQAQEPAAPAAPAPVRPAAPKAAVARPRPPAAAPVAATGAPVDVAQIVGIRQIDATTYEIDAKTQTGAPVILRMNAFVMQDLGRQLGTYGGAR